MKIRVAVGIDIERWHKRFVLALQAKLAQGYALEYELVNLERHDWIELVKPFDVVIWKPLYMGVRSASFFKEKVYIIENHLGKLMVPNFRSIWHFESKVAQSYVFSHYGIKSPRTAVSFDYQDARAQLADLGLPLVFKKSFGAASQNVRLISDRQVAHELVSTLFSQQLWDATKLHHKDVRLGILTSVFFKWFWAKVWQKLSGDERIGYAYFQEFIPENSADLRITVIGDRFAYGFWRNNRPNDFRASGSGRIDYQRSIPELPLRYCLGLNKRLGFDSMAYDILFIPDSFVITEMSFGYLDTAIYNASGHYELKGGNLDYVEGHVWPQDLWVEWALSRADSELKN
jgi:glutathione synthase/RimK-type ligase-like ATP-grasp enzyme